MSLASRVANLLQPAPSDDRGSASLLRFQEYGDGRNTHIRSMQAEEQVQTMEEKEEARPPYLHVCSIVPGSMLS